MFTKNYLGECYVHRELITKYFIVLLVSSVLSSFVDTSGQGRTANWQREVGFNELREWNNVEDAEDLIVRLVAAKEKLQKVINRKELGDDWNFELLNVFAKVSQAQKSQNKISILSLLRGSLFINQHLSKSMLIWTVKGEEKKKLQVANSLLQLIEVYFAMFPSSYIDMPLDDLSNFITTITATDLRSKVSNYLHYN